MDEQDMDEQDIDEPDMEYFYRRAVEEVNLACSAAGDKEVSFHYQLANLYLERVYAPEEPTGT